MESKIRIARGPEILVRIYNNNNKPIMKNKTEMLIFKIYSVPILKLIVIIILTNLGTRPAILECGGGKSM